MPTHGVTNNVDLLKTQCLYKAISPARTARKFLEIPDYSSSYARMNTKDYASYKIIGVRNAIR